MMNEQLSAWVDGEAAPDESAQALEAVARPGASREQCELYWLIGDVLRGQAVTGSGVASRVMSALEPEPVVLAPRRQAQRPQTEEARWMPMAAAVAGLAVAAWMGLSLWTPVQAPAVAQAPQLPAQQPSAAVALAEDQAYYMAHQASAVGAPMAGVAQYIRSVSDERAGSAR